MTTVSTAMESSIHNDGFPWHLGTFDAHCHPTDTMISMPRLAGMRASILTIMATCSQDQHLVAEVASSHGLQLPRDEGIGGTPGGCKVVPSFGWHPWFSHHLYDDTRAEPTTTTTTTTCEADSGDDDGFSAEKKAAHYRSVLQPAPEEPDFIALLPDPTPISSFISATRRQLESFPLALVGEIGLDKAFRLPQKGKLPDASARDDTPTPGGGEGRLFSPFHVRMSHQQAVLRAQLRLAGEMNRAVSVHSVQAHGVLYDTFSALWKGHERKILSRRQKKMVAPGAEDTGPESDEDEDQDQDERITRQSKANAGANKPFPPRICFHSYSGSADMLKQWFHPSVPCQVFVSFSTAINVNMGGGKAKLMDVLRAVPDDRLLVETDLHALGPDMDAALEDMYRLACEIKGWDLESGMRRIRKNFERFVYG